MRDTIFLYVMLASLFLGVMKGCNHRAHSFIALTSFLSHTDMFKLLSESFVNDTYLIKDILWLPNIIL